MFIEDEVVIKKVLFHLGRWKVKRRALTATHGPLLWKVDPPPQDQRAKIVNNIGYNS